jgi:hypothetical protein
MNQSNPPILLKQQLYTEIVSVWRINGELIEITQNSDGKYLVYKLTEKEFKEWDSYSHIFGGLNKCTKVGEKAKILQAEWGQHLE